VCNFVYGIHDGIIPIYDLYFDGQPYEPGRDPDQVWNLNNFERRYKFIGYHECGVEFDRQLGYPEQVSRFLFERVKKRMLEWVRPAEEHRILDVGCGAGYFLFLIREKYRLEGFTPIIAGLDISNFQLSYMAKRMHKEEILDALAVHGNGEYLPFADESFDLVTCSEVLEHIRNPFQALSEMHRVLKTNGMLLLSTPSMSGQKSWATILSPIGFLVKMIRRYKPETKPEENGYDIPWYPEEFRKAIFSAQLEIEEFEYNAVIPHPWHFKFLPKPLIKPTIAAFKWTDRYLKFVLKPLALHFVVRASKITNTSVKDK
jgi:ubiquinone/menaquinone biosynthesis C-methylase UbiE